MRNDRFKLFVLGVILALAILATGNGGFQTVQAQPPNFPQEEAAYQQALQYIDQHRKSDVSLKVVDQAGAAVKGASVSYQQTTHDFIFGFPGSAWATPQSWADSNEARSWALWSDLCQAVHATIILDWEEWSGIEPQRGVFQWDYSGIRPQDPDQVFQRILDQCPGTRFIVLFDDLSGDISWRHQKDPAWVNAETDDLTDPAVFAQFKQDLSGYVYHVVKHYADKVVYWITENELNGDQVQGWLGSPEKAKEIDQVVVQAIRDAQSDAKVLLTTAWPFAPIDPFDFAKQALASGLQVDGISFEAYPGPRQQTPTFFKSYIQQLSSLGKPVFIQETGYPSQNNPAEASDWSAWSGIHDEPTQAAWDKYMTAIPFGTENVSGVILVSAEDIPDPNGLFRDFGLFTRDGRTKLAYEVYRQLIQGFTTMGTGSTDASGKLVLRGFAGEYTVTVIAPDGRKVEQTIHVSETGGNSFTITLR